MSVITDGTDFHHAPPALPGDDDRPGVAGEPPLSERRSPVRRLLWKYGPVALVFAAMLTFLAAGMRPRVWWKEEKARASARRAARWSSRS